MITLKQVVKVYKYWWKHHGTVEEVDFLERKGDICMVRLKTGQVVKLHADFVKVTEGHVVKG